MFRYSQKRNTWTRVLGRDLTFDGVTYSAGTSLHNEFDYDVYLANVGYSFVRADQLSLGVGVGAHVVDIEVSFEGQGQVGGNQTSFLETNEDVLAPVPNQWAYGGCAFSPNSPFWATLDGSV